MTAKRARKVPAPIGPQCTCPQLRARTDDTQSYETWESDLNTWLGFKDSDLYAVLRAAGFGDEISGRLMARAKSHGAIKNRQALTDTLTVAGVIFGMCNEPTAGMSRCAALAEAIQYGTDYPNLPVNPLDGLRTLSANTCEKHKHTATRAMNILTAYHALKGEK